MTWKLGVVCGILLVLGVVLALAMLGEPRRK